MHNTPSQGLLDFLKRSPSPFHATQSMAEALQAAGYQALAGTVNQQVAYMVENCQLEPEADAQLHIVIARLMDSAQVMEKQNDLQVKNEAAVKLVGALNSYADYFEDASFVKPVH